MISPVFSLIRPIFFNKKHEEKANKVDLEFEITSKFRNMSDLSTDILEDIGSFSDCIGCKPIRYRPYVESNTEWVDIGIIKECFQDDGMCCGSIPCFKLTDKVNKCIKCLDDIKSIEFGVYPMNVACIVSFHCFNVTLGQIKDECRNIKAFISGE